MIEKIFFLVLVLVCAEKETHALRAVVVEDHPSTGSSPINTIHDNLQNYDKIIAGTSGDIYVFPEYGLTGKVSDPKNYAVEVPEPNSSSESYNDIIHRLSDIAKQKGKYIVVNLIEGTNNNSTLYNTNVVFDRTGKLIAKYRKINLDNEPGLTAGSETVTFSVDNLKFGTFTGIDILFPNPSQKILDGSIVAIAYPSAASSEMPLFTSTAVQEGYALSNGINLLASSLNDVSQGISGCGIYKASGEKNDYIGGKAAQKIIVETLDEQRSSLCSVIATTRSTTGTKGVGTSTFGLDIDKDELENLLVKNNSLSDFTNKVLALDSNTINEQTCDNGFCCELSLTVNQKGSEYYRLVSYNGNLNVKGKYMNVGLCAIVICETSDISSCGRRFSGSTTFSNINMTSKYAYSNNTYTRPLTLQNNLTSLNNVRYCSENGTDVTVTLSTTQETSKLIAFGIYTINSATSLSASLVFVAVIAVFLNKYIY